MDPRANPDQAVEVQRQWAGILPQLAVAGRRLRIITITINPKRDMQASTPKVLAIVLDCFYSVAVTAGDEKSMHPK